MNTTAGGRSAGSVPVRTTAREAHGEAASRTFGLPVVVDLLENLHRVRAPAAHFRVPEEEPLGLDVPVDETADRRAERLLLVGACGMECEYCARKLRKQEVSIPIQIRNLWLGREAIG